MKWPIKYKRRKNKKQETFHAVEEEQSKDQKTESFQTVGERSIHQMFRVVLVGDSRVGKSQMLYWFASTMFSSESFTTFGLYYVIKSLKFDHYHVNNASTMNVVLDENLSTIFQGGPFYMAASGIVLVYDITNRSSFDFVADWMGENRESDVKDGTVIALIGNKCDLRDKREIFAEEVQEYAAKQGLLFFEVSTVEGNSLEAAFMSLFNEIVARNVKGSTGEPANEPTVERNISGYDPPEPLYSPDEDHHANDLSSNHTGLDMKTVTVKATYGEYVIRFHISLASQFAELKEDVAKRLKLEVDTFDIKYLDDEQDWVLLTCDADLRECLDISRSSAENILRFSISDITKFGPSSGKNSNKKLSWGKFRIQNPGNSLQAKKKLSCNSSMKLVGNVLCLLPQTQRERSAKQLEMNIELLRLKAECLFNVRDTMNEEFARELVQRKKPTEELQIWLKRVEEIEHQINGLLKDKKKSYPFDVSLHERVIKIIDETVSCLEKPPPHLMQIADEPHEATRKKSFRPLMETEQQFKAEGKASEEIELSEMTLPVPFRPTSISLGKDGDGDRDSEENKDDQQTDDIEMLVSPYRSLPFPFDDSDLEDRMMHHRRLKVPGESRGTDGPQPHQSEVELSPYESERILNQGNDVSEIEEIDELEPHNLKQSTQHAPSSLFSTHVLPSKEKDTDRHSSKDQTKVGHELSERRISLMISNKQAVKKIIEYIRDVTIKRIGIYGNGGAGKSSMLRVLITTPEVTSVFDLIIFVVVSRYWNTRKIQNEFARHCGISLDDMETDSQNAVKLFQALQRRRFFLILDDVWDTIDFYVIGVPDLSEEVGSKIIITSRSFELCRNMSTDRDVQVEGLSEKESWELFHEQLGGIIDYPDIKPIARAIVERCHGFPLTIIVTGRALRDENHVLGWKQASKNFPQGTKADGVLHQLKFSYDRLPRDMKDFFLCCSLLPENQEINTYELIEFCIKEGFVAADAGDAHKRGHDILKFLAEAALFEISQDGFSLKMHNTIRDLASWILSTDEEGCQFLVEKGFRMIWPTNSGSSSSSLVSENSAKNYGMLLRARARDRSSPSDEEWENAKMMFLMDNEFSSLPDSPACPRLLALFLQRNNHLRVIPTSFFEQMPALQVLNLSNTRIKSLPQSTFGLISLRILILRHCDRFFVLPAEIGDLKNLETLDLRGTNISNLPAATGELACLKKLVVSFYGSNNQSEYVKLETELIPQNTMSKLLALEKLGIFVPPGDERWSKSIESLIHEMANFTELTSLSFCFPEVEHLKRFLRISLAWQRKLLNKFNFVIGHNINRIVSRVSADVEFVYEKQEKSLRYVNGDGEIPAAVSEVLNRATAFYLDHHLNIISLSEFGISNVKWLKVCVVSQCPEIQTIIDCKDRAGAILPSLERLSIHYLWNLRRIWRDAVPSGSFRRLKILSVYSCPRLKYVFSYSMLQYVHSLEELMVEDCPEVTQVIVEDEGVASSDKPSTSLKRLTLHHLPELISVWKGPWPLLEHISMFNCCKLKKIGLDSKLRYTIKEIKADKDWWDALHWQEEEDLFSHLQSCFTPISDDDL